MNAKSADLKQSFEAAGFSDVKTVLASGNVVFSATARSIEELARRAEAGMSRVMGRSFLTIVRSIDELAALLEADPHERFRPAPNAKRVVTFLLEPPKARLSLPLEVDGARILSVKGCEVFTAYVPSPRGPVFMKLIQDSFGKDVTTRTWDTIKKVVRAGQ